MRVSDSFVLRKVADEYLLIPTGEMAMSVKGLIALSESGMLLYEKLQSGASREELIAALMAEYEVEKRVAVSDTDGFLNQMRELGMLMEDEDAQI